MSELITQAEIQELKQRLDEILNSNDANKYAITAMENCSRLIAALDAERARVVVLTGRAGYAEAVLYDMEKQRDVLKAENEQLRETHSFVLRIISKNCGNHPAMTLTGVIAAGGGNCAMCLTGERQTLRALVVELANNIEQHVHVWDPSVNVYNPSPMSLLLLDKHAAIIADCREGKP